MRRSGFKFGYKNLLFFTVVRFCNPQAEQDKDLWENGFLDQLPIWRALDSKRKNISGRSMFYKILCISYLNRRSMRRCNLFRSFLIFSL